MKVIAFDLDDTLVAEALFTKSGIRHIARWLSSRYPELSARRIISCMDTALATRRNHYEALENYIRSAGLAETVDMNETVAEFRRHMPDPEIYHMPPSLELTLQRLKDEGIKLALVTDGHSTKQRNKIKAARLNRFFAEEDIYISEETGHDKNDPDSFLAIMRKYAGAEEYHYIGDNPEKDVLQPSKLGWHAHLVRPFPLAVHCGLPMQ